MIPVTDLQPIPPSGRRCGSRQRRKSRLRLQAEETAPASPRALESKHKSKKLPAVEYFEVEEILNEKRVNGEIKVQIKWLNYDEISWEPISSLKECMHLLKEFRHRRRSGKPLSPVPTVQPKSPVQSHRKSTAPLVQKHSRPMTPALTADPPEFRHRHLSGEPLSPPPTVQPKSPVQSHRKLTAPRVQEQSHPMTPAPTGDRCPPPVGLTVLSNLPPHSLTPSSLAPSTGRENSSLDPVVSFLSSVDNHTHTTCFTSLPLFVDIFPELLQCIKAARRIPVGPISGWKPAVSALWKTELDRLSILFKQACAQPTPLSLFNTLFAFLCAPGAVLGKCFDRGKSVVTFESPDNTVNAALRYILKGQERKALKSLCSNGVAAINSSTIASIRKLHPRRMEELKLPVKQSDQLFVESKSIEEKLFDGANDKNASKDLFGWASWLFFPWRAESGGFFSALVSFVQLLTNCPELFPSICAVLLGAGALTPLHKLSKVEQAQFAESGLEPKLRPINSGSLLSKTALSVVLQTPAARRAFDRIGPQQLSLGTPRGIERLIHTCRAAYDDGWLIGRNDYRNGFNTLSRQKMLDAHARVFPEAVSIFNLLYGVDAPVVLLDDEMKETVVWSEEGPRQGCAAGTYLFCAGIAPLVNKLQECYPEFVFLVLTDDINVLIRPPTSDVASEWQRLYTRYACFLQDLESLSRGCAGLSLNALKCGLLLPKGAPLPTNEVRNLFPSGFDFQVAGFRIAGSPVGTPAFMEEFVEERLTEAVGKLQAIKSLGPKNARATHRLLVTSGIKLLNFLASTVPPAIMLPVLKRFDKHVDCVFFATLAPGGVTCSGDRLERARLRASLPVPHGCGLFRASDQGKVAWLSSVAACLSDPFLFGLRHTLEKHVESALTLVVEAVGGESSKYWTCISQVLPTSVFSFLDGSLFSPANEFKVKIGKVILKLLSRVQTDTFMALTKIEKLSENLSKADVLRANSHTAAGRIFATPLCFALPFVLTNDQYLAWCRAFLGLPPADTIGNHVEQKGFDYPVQKCLAVHRCGSQFLDADGCHAAAHCPAAGGARMKKHNFVGRVIARAAKEAELNVRVEPDTHSLLLGEFSKSECRRIFPKFVSKHYRNKFDEVIAATEMVASPTCELSSEAKKAVVQAKVDALPAVRREDATGLRIDIAIENEITGETKWVDVTLVHTGAESYQDKELKSLCARQIAAQLSASLLVPDPFKLDPSPLLVQRTTAKLSKYSRLVLVAKKQTAEKKRKQVPQFTAFAMSDYGELAPSASDLLEWIVQQFRVKCEKIGKRTDGVPTLELVRDFRRKLYAGVQFAVAAGCGEMLCRAGQAWG